MYYIYKEQAYLAALKAANLSFPVKYIDRVKDDQHRSRRTIREWLSI